MKPEVDLHSLAIDRDSPSQPSIRTRRHVLSRYVVPSVLLVGFAALVTWAAWDLVFPPKQVTVVQVISTTAEIQQQGTPLFKAAGWIQPRPTPVRVAALAPGVVAQLLVVEDQPVECGQAVAELVKEDAELEYQRAAADLKLREAELSSAQAAVQAASTRLEQPVHLEAELGGAEAALARTETELQNLPFAIRRAEADHRSAAASYRSKTASEGVVAGVQVELAKGKMESALARVEELRDRAAALERQRAALVRQRGALETRLRLLTDEIKAKREAEAQLAAVEARLEQARVAVSQAELKRQRMTVRAPITGRVYQLIAPPGARVGDASSDSADGSTVVTMYEPNRLQIRADVRFENIPQVTRGQSVEIDNPALAEPIAGEVLFVGSEANIQKNTLEVKVAIPDPPPVFKPEMLVDVTFLAPRPAEGTAESTRERRLYLPRQLVHGSETGQYVWLADQSQGVARRTAVETRAGGGNGLVEITSGLNLSSRVIASGTEGLEDGTRIRIAGEEDAAPGSAAAAGAAPSPHAQSEGATR